jgi:RNA polymerase sigma-70 factor (ECF subfamily)
MFRKNYKQQSDEDLMQGIQQGREAAFNVLYQRYAARMQAFFYRMLYQDLELANDFTQELFLKLIKKAKLYNPQKPFAPWFYSMAHNLCKNEYQRRAREPLLEEIVPELAIINPSSAMEEEEEKARLMQAINSLEPHQKTAFILRYQEGFEIEPIAEILGCPAGTVKSRLYYASRQLNKLLKKIDKI